MPMDQNMLTQPQAMQAQVTGMNSAQSSMPQQQPSAMYNPLIQRGGASPMQGQPPQTATVQQLDEALQHNHNASSVLSGLLSNPSLSTKDALNGLTDLMKSGSITSQQAAQEASKMPTDPKQLRAYLMDHFVQNIGIGRVLYMHRIARNA